MKLKSYLFFSFLFQLLFSPSFGNEVTYQYTLYEETPYNSLSLTYNLNEKFNSQFKWDRPLESESYNFSNPELYLNYEGGIFPETEILWKQQLGFANYRYFEVPENEKFFWAYTSFDFYKYFPKNQLIEVSEFSLTPIYNKGWDYMSSSKLDSLVLSLNTGYKLPAGFSLQLDLMFLKEWYKRTENKKVWYWAIFAYLEYAAKLYNFSENLSLDFDFTGGFDPYMGSNKKGSEWFPFWIANSTYESINPNFSEGNFKSTFAFFSLPQLSITYNHSKDLSISTFVQMKYSNKTWGKLIKNWDFSPAMGLSLLYEF